VRVPETLHALLRDGLAKSVRSRAAVRVVLALDANPPIDVATSHPAVSRTVIVARAEHGAAARHEIARIRQVAMRWGCALDTLPRRDVAVPVAPGVALPALSTTAGRRAVRRVRRACSAVGLPSFRKETKRLRLAAQGHDAENGMKHNTLSHTGSPFSG
jgi:hypothetical protein